MRVEGPAYRRIAITGAAGQLGTELTRRLGPAAVPLSRAQLDLTDASKVRQTLQSVQPDLVINAAAYTAVDRAEAEPDASFAVNALAVERLADVCALLDCPLVQISTDYVFGGDAARRTPYTVDCEPQPINVYGRSKLAGEQAATRWSRHFIVRTCGLYSASSSGPRRGRNFADTMLILSQERSALRIVNDQTCTPTYVGDFVEMLLAILRSGQPGIYHATSAGAATWFEFAAELFRQAHANIQLEPITTAEYGAAAARPRYSVLQPSCGVLPAELLPPWQLGLTRYLQAGRAAR